MSVAPIDKPPDRDEEAPENADSQFSVTDEVKGLVTRVARHLGSVRARIDHNGGQQENGDRTPASPTPRTKDEHRRSDTSAPGHGDRPVSIVRRQPSLSQGPTVVGVETDRGLRLTEPGKPESRLTCDVWTSVER